jgi:hypothetical protein
VDLSGELWRCRLRDPESVGVAERRRAGVTVLLRIPVGM